MSHITTAKIKIKNPNRRLLKKALKEVAEVFNTSLIEDAVFIGFSRKRRVDYLLPIETEYGNGVGIYIDNDGSLNIIMDTHSYEEEELFEDVKNEVVKRYTYHVLKKIASIRGYVITAEEEHGDSIHMYLTR